MENTNNTTVADLIKRLYKWRKSIVIGTVIAFALACIVALILPEYYKAQTTFYAASQDLASPESVFGLSMTKTEYFGTNQDEDRIKAIARSKTMQEFLIDSFKLFEHYNIKSDDPQANYKIGNKLRKNFKLKQSENDAIHIEFIDKSPELTATIANAATEKLKVLGIQEIKNSQWQMMESYREYLSSKGESLTALQDSLSLLRREYNIIDRKTQAESLATSLSNAQSTVVEFEERILTFQRLAQRDSVRKYTAKIDGLRKKIEAMKSDSIQSGISISKFSEGSERIFTLEQEIISLTNSRNETRERLNFLQSAYESNTSAIHVLEYADTPEVKYWPQRTILVLAITILIFFLLCFYALVREGLDGINWKEISHGAH